MGSRDIHPERAAAAPELHPALAHLAFLVGTWVGEGKGHYPTVDAFMYGEEMRLEHAGKPFLTYSQRTWSLADGGPMHSEMGFWRPVPGGIEMVLAHPFGVVELQEGAVAGRVVNARSRALVATASGAEVAEVTRTIAVEGDVLRYSLDMAAAGQPLQRHLDAELRRAPS